MVRNQYHLLMGERTIQSSRDISISCSQEFTKNRTKFCYSFFKQNLKVKPDFTKLWKQTNIDFQIRPQVLLGANKNKLSFQLNHIETSACCDYQSSNHESIFLNEEKIVHDSYYVGI